MGNMRAGKRICQSNLKRILGNVRFYLALAWFAMTLCFYMLQLRALATQLELPVSIWCLPLLLTKSGNQMFLILGAVLLFCDAPFLYDNSGWQIIRAGRKCWFWGNIGYMAVLSLIYTVSVAVIPVLFEIPHISFKNEWGALLGSMAQTSLANQYGLTSLSYQIMARYDPMEAMGYVLLAVWLNTMLIGVVNYTANLLIRQGSGPVFCLFIGLTPVLLDRALPPFVYISYYLSPPAWLNLENYNWDGYGAAPAPGYIYGALIGLIVIGIFVCRYGIMKKDLYVIENI